MLRFFLAGAIIVLSGMQASAAPELAILTGGTSGVYYPIGIAIGKIFEKEIPEQKFSVVSTQATVENLNLLQQGRGILALGQGDILSQAWKGNAEAGFPSSRTKIRLIGAAFPNIIHVAARQDSNINSIQDLRGKRISVGAARSGNELNARALLSAADMSYADILQVEYLEYGASIDLMISGQLDAAIISAGIGVPAIMTLVSKIPTTIVPVPRSLVEKTNGLFYPTVIPALTYARQTRDVPAAALANFFVTTADATDDLAYRMTKAIYSHLADLRAAHPAAVAMSVENAVLSHPIQMHSGAERYFKEIHILK